MCVVYVSGGRFVFLGGFMENLIWVLFFFFFICFRSENVLQFT